MTPVIRTIAKDDNPVVAGIIRSVLIEMGVPKVGTAYEDASLDRMYETYQADRAQYYVIEEEGRLIGGGGIAVLENYDGTICELQKMYFLPEARGRGLGTRLIDICLEEAKAFGYQGCYLETMSYMETAKYLYEKYGFELLDGPMGDTGHYACGVHMLKTL